MTSAAKNSDPVKMLIIRTDGPNVNWFTFDKVNWERENAITHHYATLVAVHSIQSMVDLKLVCYPVNGKFIKS